VNPGRTGIPTCPTTRSVTWSRRSPRRRTTA